MIFVTVGTHEQPFNRLIECIDNLKGEGFVKDEVFLQTGFSNYEPKYCNWSKLLPYKKMVENVSNARIVVTHGGPSSFIMPLQVGKIPVVVPRQHVFNEHVNNHQVDFARAVAERMGNIIVVYSIKDMKRVLTDYEKIVASMSSSIKSNNDTFNTGIEKIVQELFEK